MFTVACLITKGVGRYERKYFVRLKRIRINVWISRRLAYLTLKHCAFNLRCQFDVRLNILNSYQNNSTFTEKHLMYVTNTKLHTCFDIAWQIALVCYEEGFNSTFCLVSFLQRTHAICCVIYQNNYVVLLYIAWSLWFIFQREIHFPIPLMLNAKQRSNRRLYLKQILKQIILEFLYTCIYLLLL